MTTPDLRSLGRTVDELQAEHKQLEEVVADVVDSVEALRESRSRAEPGGWSWPSMDAERAAVVWNWLAEFVAHLNSREELSPQLRIPPCWFLHGRAIEDLTAVLAAWQDAYYGTSGPTSDPISYRDRWLWPTLARIADRNSPMQRCAEKGQHQEWKEPGDAQFKGTDGKPFNRHGELAEHIVSDLAERPAGRAKE